jgi:hypothetical protein
MSDTVKTVKSIALDGETDMVRVMEGETVLCTVHKDALSSSDFALETGDDLYEYVKGFTSIDDAVEAIKSAAAGA